MPRVEFKPTIPVFERAKTVHALGRVLTTTLQLATQRLLHPHFSNGMVACLRYEHCGATSVQV
jgi:hypothetical protein